jgi:hypothetical protein
MEKIDRLGWAAGLSFTSYGVRVGIRVNNPAVLGRLPGYLPHGWKPSPGPVVDELFSLIDGGSAAGSNVRRYHLLYWEASRVVRTMDLGEVFEGLESTLDLAVAVRARHRLFVRAAVVGWGGRALVVCGPSHEGRGALAAALVRAGAVYYSDRYAVLDARGRVHPYPRPLALGDESGGRPPRLPAEALGGRTGTKPLPVGLVALTGDRPGARWRPRALSAGRAVLGLLGHTVQARLCPGAVLATLGQAVAGARAFQGKCGGAEDLARSLLHQLGNGAVDSSSRVPNS